MQALEWLLADVDHATVDALSKERRCRDFSAGDQIVRCDEMSGHLYHLLAGRAKVWRPVSDGRMLLLSIYGTGEVVGLGSVDRARSSPTAVSAITEVRTESWSVELFRSLMRADPRLAQNVLHLTRKRLGQLIHRLEDVTGLRAEQKLARALLHLAAEEGSWSNAAHVTVPVNRQDLADMTGTTLHTASRTLSFWGERGIIASTRGLVTIVHPDKIGEIADLHDEPNNAGLICG